MEVESNRPEGLLLYESSTLKTKNMIDYTTVTNSMWMEKKEENMIVILDP